MVNAIFFILHRLARHYMVPDMDYDDLISGVKRYAEARSIRPETVCFYATCKAGTKKGGEYRTWQRIVCGTAHRSTMDKVWDYILRE